MKRNRIKIKIESPYKIGDKIEFKKGDKAHTMTITDVIAETSYKAGRTTFRLELDGWYMLDTKLHDVKIGGD